MADYMIFAVDKEIDKNRNLKIRGNMDDIIRHLYSHRVEFQMVDAM